MKYFLKKYFKRPIQSVGLYRQAHHLFFLLLEKKTCVENLFLKEFKHTAPILLYHRIASPEKDPVMLCVAPERFEEHLKFLKKNYDIIPLSEISQRLITGKLNGSEAAITFDDGYQDNLTNALPLLEKYQIPATIFITTGLIGKKANYKWDLEYREEDRAFFLDREEIKRRANNPLIEIGSHTETHPNLANLTQEEQKGEILKSKLKLEEITGHKIKSFAYPFGGIYDFSKTTKKIIKELGFDFAYSNSQKLAQKTKDPFSIPRLNILDIPLPKLAKKIVCQIKNF
jgi:peptidoglycan/xylan/chitin deacetylase (PgdA/CDA1 family)